MQAQVLHKGHGKEVVAKCKRPNDAKCEARNRIIPNMLIIQHGDAAGHFLLQKML